mmetsp:Transcript_8382/g.22377  ORF Transcript_8382/g.22377 Transcript_8382/m.22377 type:complete len:137 (-) Transcript_8382:4087-4497(-)
MLSVNPTSPFLSLTLNNTQASILSEYASYDCYPYCHAAAVKVVGYRGVGGGERDTSSPSTFHSALTRIMPTMLVYAKRTPFLPPSFLSSSAAFSSSSVTFLSSIERSTHRWNMADTKEAEEDCATVKSRRWFSASM